MHKTKLFGALCLMVYPGFGIAEQTPVICEERAWFERALQLITDIESTPCISTSKLKDIEMKELGSSYLVTQADDEAYRKSWSALNDKHQKPVLQTVSGPKSEVVGMDANSPQILANPLPTLRGYQTTGSEKRFD